MKRHLGLIGLTVAVIAGVVAYTQIARSDSTPAPVTARVTRGSIVDTVDATGTIQPVNTVQVGTQVSAPSSRWPPTSTPRCGAVR